MKELFGLFNLRARIGASAILLSPMLIHLFILFPELREISSTILTICISFSASSLLIFLMQGNGNAILKKIYPQMLPAQRMLLPSDSTMNTYTKKRCYKLFSMYIEGFLEVGDESEINAQIDSAISWLISNTRDTTKFPVVAEENINLSYSYNLRALKYCGIILNSILLLIDVASFVPDLQKYYPPVDKVEIILCVALALLFMVIWIFFITYEMVRKKAERYARTLLSACDILLSDAC